MNSHIITPGPYRATKLWNEVTRLFRAGMPLRKHRQHFRTHAGCFTATAAVDWLHELLRNNSNFGPDVTRQQTVQLLKKLLKNHVIEDVKGRWGNEELEDDSHLFRFPSVSPLKPIPCPASVAPGSVKRSFSFREKEGFFKFRSNRKADKETLENVDPQVQSQEQEVSGQPMEGEQTQRRELTEEDEQEIWRDITLTHLQKILGLTALEDVLDQRHVNPQNIIYNMTRVNKHGVVTLDDKTADLPHWVLSAMKSLANWPKYDSGQPSYSGFERDVFKTVSDYFYTLPQPLLTYELYELFVNVLVLCGYVVVPPRPHRGKRKIDDPPPYPPPAKTAHVGGANFFKSTECLLLSLLRKESCDETDSPMREVFSSKVKSRLSVLKGGVARRASLKAPPLRRVSAGASRLGGSCMSLSQSESFAGSTRLRPRSCSLETILDDHSPLASQLFLSNDSLASSSHNNNNTSDCGSQDNSATTSHNSPDSPTSSSSTSVTTTTPGAVPGLKDPAVAAAKLSVRRFRPLRPRSMGSCLDIVTETREDVAAETGGKTSAISASCFNIHTPVAEITVPPSSSSSSSSSSSLRVAVLRSSCIDLRSGPASSSLLANGVALRAGPGSAVGRRCLSSLDLTRLARPVSLMRPAACLTKPPVCQNKPVSLPSDPPNDPSPDNSLLKPQCERVAVEALQLCTLLLPPASRRKLQLLMRMTSRMTHNVDMPRLHHAIGTRTLMVHTFSGCVLASKEEGDLDELLATKLVSFLMDHHQDILSVPGYLLNALQDHLHYLRTAQVPFPAVCANGPGEAPGQGPVALHAFCRQISSKEFEEQRVSASQRAMADLLEVILTDSRLADKERRKKLKQFQKQYPDIYSHRFPSSSDRETQPEKKPKIKPPMLLSTIRKTKAFSIRN
ncbi:DEP domain-containing protein 1A [Aplochiton taeniatus]